MDQLGKTGILARDKRIDYILFDAPDGERYGKIIGWRPHDTLIALTLPYYGGDERTYLIQSRNYSVNTWGNFSCTATVTPIKYDGEVVLDGESTEAIVKFYLIPPDYSVVYVGLGAACIYYFLAR